MGAQPAGPQTLPRGGTPTHLAQGVHSDALGVDVPQVSLRVVLEVIGDAEPGGTGVGVADPSLLAAVHRPPPPAWGWGLTTGTSSGPAGSSPG